MRMWLACVMVVLLAVVASAQGDDGNLATDEEGGGVSPASVVDPDWVETVVATHTTGSVTRIIESRRVVAGDIDGDGDEDMVAAHMGAGSVSWYENDGTGSLTEYELATGFGYSSTVFIADVDGDGDQDIVAGSGTLGIQWFENDGSQSFTAHTVTTAEDCYSIVAVDLDQDGDVDFVSAAVDELQWWSNDGTQSFTNTVLASSLSVVSWVAVEDMDNDGDFDIVDGEYSGDSVTLYVNDGAESFTGYTVASLDGASSARIVDINKDGAMDIVATGYGAEAALWFESDGGSPPTFTSHTLGSASGMASVYPVDIDNDGDMDVVSAAFSADSVQWYENMDGVGGSWTEHDIVTSQDRAVALFAADFDSDGRTDVALVYGSGNNALAVYQNNYAGTVSPTQAPTGESTVRPTADWLADFWESLYDVVDNHEKVWKYAKALDKLDTATYSGIRAYAKDISKLISKSYFKSGAAARGEMHDLIEALEQDVEVPLLRGGSTVNSSRMGVGVADEEEEALESLRKYLNKVMRKCESLNNGVLYFEYYDLLAMLNGLD